jgi:hypothetical protein
LGQREEVVLYSEVEERVVQESAQHVSEHSGMRQRQILTVWAEKLVLMCCLSWRKVGQRRKQSMVQPMWTC